MRTTKSQSRPPWLRYGAAAVATELNVSQFTADISPRVRSTGFLHDLGISGVILGLTLGS